MAMWLMWLMWLDAPARHVAHVAARRGGQYSGQYYSLSVAYNTGAVLYPSWRIILPLTPGYTPSGSAGTQSFNGG